MPGELAGGRDGRVVAVQLHEPRLGELADLRERERDRLAPAVDQDQEVVVEQRGAVLGALVFSQLNASLTSHLLALNVPAAEKTLILGFKSTIITFIETGQTPTSYTSYGAIVNQVIGAAYASFGDGLHDALYLSAGLVIVAGLLAAATLRGRQPDLL